MIKLIKILCRNCSNADPKLQSLKSLYQIYQKQKQELPALDPQDPLFFSKQHRFSLQMMKIESECQLKQTIKSFQPLGPCQALMTVSKMADLDLDLSKQQPLELINILLQNINQIDGNELTRFLQIILQEGLTVNIPNFIKPRPVNPQNFQMLLISMYQLGLKPILKQWLDYTDLNPIQQSSLSRIYDLLLTHNQSLQGVPQCVSVCYLGVLSKHDLTHELIQRAESCSQQAQCKQEVRTIFQIVQYLKRQKGKVPESLRKILLDSCLTMFRRVKIDQLDQTDYVRLWIAVSLLSTAKVVTKQQLSVLCNTSIYGRMLLTRQQWRSIGISYVIGQLRSYEIERELIKLDDPNHPVQKKIQDYLGQQR